MQAGGLTLAQPNPAEYLIHLTLFLNARHHVTFGKQVGPTHGHSWRVDLALRTAFRDGPGETPIEFAELDRRAREVLRPYEGQFLNDVTPFDRVAPTTENLARFVFGRVRQAVRTIGVDVVQVCVWEAPTKGVTVASPLPEALMIGTSGRQIVNDAAATAESAVRGGSSGPRREEDANRKGRA